MSGNASRLPTPVERAQNALRLMEYMTAHDYKEIPSVVSGKTIAIPPDRERFLRELRAARVCLKRGRVLTILSRAFGLGLACGATVQGRGHGGPARAPDRPTQNLTNLSPPSRRGGGHDLARLPLLWRSGRRPAAMASHVLAVLAAAAPQR